MFPAIATPQLGHLSAASDTSCPHSGHFTIAIIRLFFYGRYSPYSYYKAHRGFIPAFIAKLLLWHILTAAFLFLFLLFLQNRLFTSFFLQSVLHLLSTVTITCKKNE